MGMIDDTNLSILWGGVKDLMASKLEKINKNIKGYYEGYIDVSSSVELDFSDLENQYSHTREIIVIYNSNFNNILCGEYRAVNSYRYGLVKMQQIDSPTTSGQVVFTIDEENRRKLKIQNTLTYTSILYRVHIL